MAIPLFTPGYLASPTAEGVVSPATANLFISEGKALAERIEQQSQKSEAQMKAPAMATVYADAFTRLGQGDVSAFGDIERANGLAAGNPFLMSMAKDAQRTAGMMVSNYFQTQQDQLRFQNQQSLQEAQIKAQAARQEEQLKYYEGRDNDILERERLRDERTAQRQEDDDARALNAKMLMKYEEDMKAYNEAVAGNQRLKQLNQPERPLPPKPERPALVPSRVLKSEPLVNESLPQKLPNGKKASLIEADNGLFGVMPEDIPSTNESQDGAAATAEAPSMTQAAPPQSTSKPETVERVVGDLTFELPAPKERGDVEVTESIKTGTGAVNVKRIKSDDPAAKLANALGGIQAEDPAFAKWMTEQRMAGAAISIRKTPSGKTSVYQPVAVYKDKTEKPYGAIDENQQPTNATKQNATKQVSESIYENFVEAQKLMEGEMKGKVKIYRNVDDSAKQAAYQKFLDSVAKGEVSLEDANQRLSFIRAKPLDPEEVERRKKQYQKQESDKNLGGALYNAIGGGWATGLR